ncbi:MAG: restriction endonuclease subunit S [Actinomycetota bacterium]
MNAADGSVQQEDNHWARMPIAELCEVIQGQSPPGSTYNTAGEGLPFFQGKAEFGDLFPTATKWCTAPKKIAEPGDVLISVRAPVGPTNLCRERSAIGRGLAALRSHEGIPSKYVLYALRATQEELRAGATGSTFEAINGSQLRSHEIALAPLEDREVIVSEIEKQFTRLDAGVASLRRVQANLKRYRAAVLQAAVTGRLVPTEAALARGENGPVVSAENLLGNENVPESALPANGSLPEGWVAAKFAEVAERVTVGHVGPMKDEYRPTGMPFLRSQNVRENRFDPAGLKYIDAAFHLKLKKSRILPGDLLIVRSGSVGTACVLPDSIQEANCADLVVVQGLWGILPKFAAYYMNSEAKAEVRAGQVGVALTHFNTKSVARLQVPVPPMREQTRIVAAVERHLSIIDELEREVTRGLRRGANLRQAVLGTAFTGRLAGAGS